MLLIHTSYLFAIFEISWSGIVATSRVYLLRLTKKVRYFAFTELESKFKSGN